MVVHSLSLSCVKCSSTPFVFLILLNVIKKKTYLNVCKNLYVTFLTYLRLLNFRLIRPPGSNWLLYWTSLACSVVYFIFRLHDTIICSSITCLMMSVCVWLPVSRPSGTCSAVHQWSRCDWKEHRGRKGHPRVLERRLKLSCVYSIWSRTAELQREADAGVHVSLVSFVFALRVGEGGGVV